MYILFFFIELQPFHYNKYYNLPTIHNNTNPYHYDTKNDTIENHLVKINCTIIHSDTIQAPTAPTIDALHPQKPLHRLTHETQPPTKWWIARISKGLTLGPSTGTGTLLMRLEASKGGLAWGGVVVGGAWDVIGNTDPNWKCR